MKCLKRMLFLEYYDNGMKTKKEVNREENIKWKEYLGKITFAGRGRKSRSNGGRVCNYSEREMRDEEILIHFI